MGMDIYGKNPSNKQGEYIRFGAFSWPQYARFMEQIAPEIMVRVKYLYSNDGDGLNAEDSKIVGERILSYLTSQTLVNYIENLPERPTSFHREGGKLIESNYRKLFEVERLEELAHFLINCGGFEIN